MAAPTKLVVSSVFRPGLLKDKVAIVTGGGTGIGKAITQELLYLGCSVMIASRKFDRLEASALKMREWLNENNNPSRLEYMTCNIRKEEDVKKLISTTVESFGKLDYLVNNGGGQFPSPAENISNKGWLAVIDTNLNGTFTMCRETYKLWMKDHGGVIVNIIADMWKGFPMMSHTGAARAGVDNLTKSLSLEWVHNGVRVNSVAPGSTIYSDTAAANYADPESFEKNMSTVPMKRLGKVEEVSSVVTFLLSPGASFITGETVKVDAGQSLYALPTLPMIPDHSTHPPYSWEEDAKLAEEQKKAMKNSNKSQKAKL